LLYWFWGLVYNANRTSYLTINWYILCPEGSAVICIKFFKHAQVFFQLIIVISAFFNLNAQTTTPISESIDGITIPTQVVADWEEQDRIASVGYNQAITSIATTLPTTDKETITAELESISSLPTANAAWKNLYIKAAHFRRVSRMKPYTNKLKNIVFSSHYTMGGLFQGFQEGIGSNKCSDYRAGSALCLLTFDNYYSQFTKIHESANGVVKDPDVSYDGNKILFAETKDNNGFHLYEMDVATKNIRQLTSNPPNLRISDFDGCYLPNGDIAFQSSRCFGLVDCFYNITSNLYICSSDGNYLRRIGYDQVQTFYPTMMSDGKVLYTRWEYNDRSQVYSMGLFTMNPDGTNQNEFYGNQSWWPTSIIHARNIPGSSKVLAILSGHHTAYAGQIAIIDPNLGRQEATGVTLVAPVKKPTAVRRDNGGVNFLFQTPYPLDEQFFITGYRQDATSNFALYFMNIDGTRELIAWDAENSLNKPVSLAARTVPPRLASMIDYTKNTGIYTMQNVYVGTGLPGVAKGTIKKLRVVALDYRIDNAIGYTFWRTNEYDLSAHTYTPIARSSGSWDVKRILGETPVESDGSAAFIVPARTPLFFQAVDSLGRVVQTMRSWSTLMPGETFSCVGCHEDKNSAPPQGAIPIATTPRPLQPFHGVENQGFSYPKFIQPLWDKNCTRCHNASHTKGLDLRADAINAIDLSDAWRTDFADRDFQAKKSWNQSYLKLTEVRGKYVDWNTTQSYPSGLAPNSVGSVKSPLLTKLRNGHSNIALTQKEMDLIAAWIDLCIPHSGTYTEGMNADDQTSYNNSVKRKTQWETLESQNIEQFIARGQYGTASVNNPLSDKRTPDNALSTRFCIVNNHTLTVNFASPGDFTLLDLMGHRILTIPCETITGRSIEAALPATLSPGTYIGQIKPRGNSGLQNIHQKVMVF